MIRKLSLVLAILILACTPLRERSDSKVSARDKIIVRDTFMGVPVPSVTLDRYGGRTDIQCPAGKGWTTAKINNRWWICTPARHAMFMQGLMSLNPYAGEVAKYGSNAQYVQEIGAEIQSWNFNTWNWYVYQYMWPSNMSRVKLPMWENVRAGFYSIQNPLIDTVSNGSIRLISEPTKNLIYVHSPVYTDWMYAAVLDFYDAKLYTWLNQDLAKETLWQNALRVPAQGAYFMGMGADDSDELAGFKNGNDFVTIPSGKNALHGGWWAATISPTQTANDGSLGIASAGGTVFADTVVYLKKYWHDYLVAKYGTVGALNTAWGSNYTTFDSSGTQYVEEAIGVGDGLRRTFSHTLAHTTVDQFTVQIFVGGSVVGGDTRQSTLFGPTISRGTINYSTGVISATFSSAPANGAAITANYHAKGWQVGTGVLDEDGRAGHTWMGNWLLVGTNSAVRADFDAYLKQVSDHYHSQHKKAFNTYLPGTLFFSDFGGWAVPGWGAALQGASPYVDVFDFSTTGAYMTQPMLDYYYNNAGDKPIFYESFLSGNADSPLSEINDSSDDGKPSQLARGQAYTDMINQELNTANSHGIYPMVGIAWWSLYDSGGEGRNWGLLSAQDNAYDGHEDVPNVTPCSHPLEKYKCGGERRNYGDVVTAVRQANSLWMQSTPR